MKIDEMLFEFINSTWREYEDELYYDAIYGGEENVVLTVDDRTWIAP